MDLFSNLPEWDPTPACKPIPDAVSPGRVRSSASTTAESTAVRRTPEPQPCKAAATEYPAYHDTVPGVDVEQATAQAKKQEDRVLRLYVSAGRPLAPSEVHRRVGGASPLTSTRRAITGLTERGQLVRLDTTQPGPYGRPEHLWRAA